MRRSSFASSIAVIALGAVTLLRGDEPAKAVASQAEALSKEVRAVVEKVGDAICRVEADDEHGHLKGTGFFIDADGTLLTSFSIGGESRNIIVTAGEQRFPATRLVADSRAGIAVLKVVAERPVRCLKFGDSSELAVASPVMTAGYPLDLPLSPSFGLVAGMEIKIHVGNEERYLATRHIRANVPVQRGQGGSPVLNLQGEAVGILISTVEENSGIFALPIEAAAKVLHDFRTHGRIRQGWLGVDVREFDPPLAGSSARIQTLREDAPGYLAGLRPGDVLLSVGRWKISTPEDVLNAAFFVTSTEPLKMRVLRGAVQREFSVTPTDPPDGSMPSIERQLPPALGASGLEKPLGLGK
ncbi:MAG: S1C family serine protease [Chthoniobacteraceae bacterium]